MASLRWKRLGLALLATALAGGAALAESAAAEPAAVDPAALVASAELALRQADFDTVRDLAQKALAALDASAGAAVTGASAGAAGAVSDARVLRGRALDLLAQAQFNLGARAAMLQTIDRLLTVDPGHRVDSAVAGAKFAAAVEERRRKLVGRIVLTCTPLPCEVVRVDGTPFTPETDGTVAALAGKRALVVGRRNFKDKDAGEVTVVAGEQVPLAVELELVARDLVLATSPAGVRVHVDGKDAGVTEAGPAADVPSRPLTVPSLAPGPHVVVLQAPCQRRLEQSVEVVLDAQNVQAQDLGVITLERARSVLGIQWDGSAGELFIDGRPVEGPSHEVCPGHHEVSLAVAGRRVWFESVDLRDDEPRTLTPKPRPTAAVLARGGAGASAGLPGDGWNIVSVAPEAGDALWEALAPHLSPPAPVHPGVSRRPAPGLAAAARSAAPEADIVAVTAVGAEAVGALVTLALVDTRRDIVELTAWPEKDAKVLAALRTEMDRPLRWFALVAGFDVADRVGRAPVIASVLADSPAAKAGLEAGQVLVAVQGSPAQNGAATPGQLESSLAPGEAVTVRVQGPDGVERAVQFTPAQVVAAPSPAALRAQSGLLLVPFIARAGVARIAGTSEERMAGGLLEGMGLAAAGLDADAAAALDRASIDERLDPAGDARGTAAFALERLLRKLKRTDYADEVRARWRLLPGARFGGRSGPPLRAAQDLPED